MRYKASGTYLRTKVFDTVDKAVDAARKVMYMDAQELLDARKALAVLPVGGVFTSQYGFGTISIEVLADEPEIKPS